MENVRVSVIVPVYNSERYLKECVDSLLSQTLPGCEFLFVNDGSTDRSGVILNEYAERDSRIRVIEQPNGGVSAARNRGLQEACGAYIGFVDADDSVESDFFETLYHAAEKEDCDIVVSTFAASQEGTLVVTEYGLPTDRPLNRDEIQRTILPYFLREENLNAVWTKLYRASLLQERNVRFPIGVALGEDALFNMEAFVHASNVRVLNYLGYRYREVPGSATRNILAKDYFRRALEIYELRLPAFESATGLPEENLTRLRAEKLIYSVLSYVYLYLSPSPEVPLRKRLAYVRKMIRHERVREALPFYWKERYQAGGRYERMLLWLVKTRLTAGLYAATAYSRMRNQGNRRPELL
ncbi:glycosyltransferase [Gorillibacterium sp. CAU 1737]|uniref:glycosyltransferase n=1 Tax=Gorillibacterium sp. CAU 1737 TaxID=3140362 RepID=UPI0032614F8D